MPAGGFRFFPNLGTEILRIVKPERSLSGTSNKLGENLRPCIDSALIFGV